MKKSRLLKNIIAEENNMDGMMTMESNPAAISPFGIVFRGAEEKVSNDPLTKTHYSTSDSKEFLFEKDIKNPEWMLRDAKKTRGEL